MSEEVIKGILEELVKVKSLEVRQRVFARLLQDFHTSQTVRKQLQANVCTPAVVKRVRKYVKEEGGVSS